MDYTLDYTYTNESLDSVIAGMYLHPEDNVLAIGGSWDQAFAMIEYAGHVTGVDLNPLQADFAKERKQLLESGDFEGFLNHLAGTGAHDRNLEPFRERRDRYFSMERMAKIRNNLNRLEIRTGNIFGFRGRGFSRIYLSNALGHVPEMFRDVMMEMIQDRLAFNGLLYITNEVDVTATEEVMRSLAPEPLLSERACMQETSMWHPAVYRKA